MRKNEFGQAKQQVRVQVTGFGDGAGSATVTIPGVGDDRSVRVNFGYTAAMTAGQMELAALKLAASEYEEVIALLRSDISDRETRQS